MMRSSPAFFEKKRISDIQDRFPSRNYSYISYWRNEKKKIPS
jgi:hypothetical protein